MGWGILVPWVHNLHLITNTVWLTRYSAEVVVYLHSSYVIYMLYNIFYRRKSHLIMIQMPGYANKTYFNHLLLVIMTDYLLIMHVLLIRLHVNLENDIELLVRLHSVNYNHRKTVRKLLS